MHWATAVALAVSLVLAAPALAADEYINPYPRPIVVGGLLKEYVFDKSVQGWGALHNCTISVAAGAMRIDCTGEDPYLSVACKLPATQRGIVARIRMKSTNAGSAELFWTTQAQPGWGPKMRQGFQPIDDGKWHEYEVLLGVSGSMTGLRLDPGVDKGRVQVAWIRLHEGSLHPLEICRLEALGDAVRAHVRNHGDRQEPFSVDGQEYTVAPGKTAAVPVKLRGQAPFEAVAIEIKPKDLPPVRRTTVVYRPEAKADWVVLEGRFAAVKWQGQDRDLSAMIATEEVLKIHAARDGSGAMISLNGRPIACLAPLVWRDGMIPAMKLASSGPAEASFTGDGLSVSLAIRMGEIDVQIDSGARIEGPVVRAAGVLEQGVFAGLEYLGKGEHSSSTLDIETPDHLRFAPDPLKVTMPLMAFLTDRSGVAMTWQDMSLEPTYATPNFFDGTSDHRMSLRGSKIRATILVRQAALEGMILWAVKKMGLPPGPPKEPRTRQQQWKLAVDCINGPIDGPGGWGHCAEPKWGRQPYADVASTLWRLTGKVPQLERIVPGGAHVPNDAIYFVTGRADEWLRVRGGQAQATADRQAKDGSFRYTGDPKFRRGHFEDTSSGWCARQARTLLEYAHYTGDQRALDAGLKALEYMKRFQVPRGAQTWELSLHTPDILASADLVWSYVRGYELTADREYLGQARRWALSGVPFVYLWGKFPIMRYAAVPVFGATNFQAPLWIGLPVQWCGGVYAYALALLAEHDHMVDWQKLARGILIAGEQMQYPGGPLAGCLPDVFYLTNQLRAGPSINPCALASLRMVLDGQLDSLAVVSDGRHRVTSPLPVRILEGKARIQGQKGLKYQILIDGKRIVDVESKGADEIPLE